MILVALLAVPFIGALLTLISPTGSPPRLTRLARLHGLVNGAGGRAALGLFGNRATPARLLDAGVVMATLGALGFWLGPPLVAAFIALPILGIAVSLIFPLLLSLTPERVGTAMTPHTVGYGLAAGPNAAPPVVRVMRRMRPVLS